MTVRIRETVDDDAQWRRRTTRRTPYAPINRKLGYRRTGRVVEYLRDRAS